MLRFALLYCGWLKFRGVPIFMVFVEGQIHEFQYPRNGNFLYELWKWPQVLSSTNVSFLFNPRKLVPTKIICHPQYAYRSTEGCLKLKRSVDLTSSGKNGLNIRTNASPKWDRTRCPEELVSSVGYSRTRCNVLWKPPKFFTNKSCLNYWGTFHLKVAVKKRHTHTHKGHFEANHIIFLHAFCKFFQSALTYICVLSVKSKW